MSTTHTSTACCTTPVPTSQVSYTPKGTYTTFANTETYIVGPQNAKKAVFFIYDIMGYRPPTLQGADILSRAGYLVVMPDFFDDGTAQLEWLANPENEGYKAKFGAFMAKIQDIPRYTARIDALLGEVKTSYSGVEKWASIGYCWGGKMVSLTSGASTPWSVGIQTSPAFVDPEDAKKATIPMMLLASKDEPEDKVKEFDKALTVPKHVETFSTQVHGWMSARADLAEAEPKKEYERGYQIVLEFLSKYL